MNEVVEIGEVAVSTEGKRRRADSMRYVSSSTLWRGGFSQLRREKAIPSTKAQVRSFNTCSAQGISANCLTRVHYYVAINDTRRIRSLIE